MRPPVVPSSGLAPGLRPSTAYLLVQLAKPQLGDVLVDAMCGGGAALVEGAYSHKCIALGGDVDLEQQPTLQASVRQAGEMSAHKTIAEVLIGPCTVVILIVVFFVVVWLPTLSVLSITVLTMFDPLVFHISKDCVVGSS